MGDDFAAYMAFLVLAFVTALMLWLLLHLLGAL